jgi:hypothetical protein
MTEIYDEATLHARLELAYYLLTSAPTRPD